MYNQETSRHLIWKKDPESPSLRSRAQDDTSGGCFDSRVILRSPEGAKLRILLRQYSVLLPLLLSGCGVPIVGGLGSVGMHAVEDRGLGGSISDEALQFTIRSKLCGELPNCHVIDMTVYKDRVLMTGIVENQQRKVDAVRIAKSVDGVKEVIDGLNIEGQDTFSEYVRDGWITTKVKAALYSDEDIYAPNYTITTFDKIVYIFGTAGSNEEMKKVIENAYDIAGVKRVVNLIEIKAPAPQ